MAGAAACVGVLTGLLAAGCSGTVDVSGPTTGPPECRALLAALPGSVGGQEAREVEPEAALAAAWGDPAIVLRCGVPEPSSLQPSSTCAEVNGVGWFTEREADAFRFTSIGRTTAVEVEVPYDYEPAADALVDVAAAVRRSVPEIQPCV
jgi:Protein of unknown function (DUF3515)